jgi:outer membrane protein insertion porin family
MFLKILINTFNNTMKIKICILTIIIFFVNQLAFSDILKNISITGNERISIETIQIFSGKKINDEINDNDINIILKDIYSTGFFDNVNVSFINGELIIEVKENPIIQEIYFEGIKAKKILDELKKNLKLKSRSSFNENYLLIDKKSIISTLRNLGYYYSSVDVYKDKVDNNKLNIVYKVNLGSKAKIKKISFIGDKIFKDSKLKRLIVSEEYRFWKFISGKKYLNENLIDLDNRLLKNYYLNKGYYDVKINSSFARMNIDESFELIYNIDAGKKFYFGNVNLVIPTDFDKNNFKSVYVFFNKIKGSDYSIFTIEKILDQIESITLSEQFISVSASLNEKTRDNIIDIDFIVTETEPLFVERINILGNNVTQENVIRNQLMIDEGDPYNEILKNKSINQIKNLNFFKSVKSDVIDGAKPDSKIININIEEKPTGEIGASAGVGTSGSTLGFSVRENNFLGKGIALDSNLLLSTDSIKGLFSVRNPNFLNSDKNIYTTLEASELDKLSQYGYKTSKTGFSLGSNFEYFDDLRFGIGISNYYQNIETDSTASEKQKKQKGDYWDSYLKFDFDYDKRNEKFQTTSGFRSFYSVDIPYISETYSLINTYDYKYFLELYDQNITIFSLYLNSVNSISNKNVKLSERLYVPSSKLRGFEYGSVGPKDGNDYIGGNYISTLNLSTTLPKILENSQNTDFLIFFDVANIWGVDYDNSVDDSNKIRSSIGLALDWFTPVGPLNFSLSQPISKAKSDKTETFRFNLGTTF